MNEELSNLISEVREQVLYLQELGVEHLDADLPEVNFASKTEKQHPQSQISNPQSEYVVPDISIIPKTVPKIDTPLKSVSDGSRLSRLLSSSSINNPITPPIQENQPPKIIAETMPKKEVINETALFDIRQKLPDANETVAEIQTEIGNCQGCDLCKERTNIAHSTGNLNANLMFIGEAPGADEDAQGKPFVGRAGQLLTKIIEAIAVTT